MWRRFGTLVLFVGFSFLCVPTYSTELAGNEGQSCVEQLSQEDCLCEMDDDCIIMFGDAAWSCQAEMCVRSSSSGEESES